MVVRSGAEDIERGDEPKGDRQKNDREDRISARVLPGRTHFCVRGARSQDDIPIPDQYCDRRNVVAGDDAHHGLEPLRAKQRHGKCSKPGGEQRERDRRDCAILHVFGTSGNIRSVRTRS
jgi:hypothetical protein